jgi:hypothetical protein
LGDYKLVDPFLNLPSEPGTVRTPDPNIARWFKDSKALLHGATIDDMVADMDETGIESGIVTASSGGVPDHPYNVGQNQDEEPFVAVLEKVGDDQEVPRALLRLRGYRSDGGDDWYAGSKWPCGTTA